MKPMRRGCGTIGGPGYFKDGFHERIVGGRTDAVNPARTGTKAGVWYQSHHSRRRQAGISPAAVAPRRRRSPSRISSSALAERRARGR